MKWFISAIVLTALAACSDSDGLQPSAGIGIGIGPGGLSVRPRVSVSDGTSSLSASPGGVRAGVSNGPVSVGVGL